MPKLRSILLAAAIAGISATAAGCGDSGPKPSISPDDASALQDQIDEIQRNVDVGSCFIAADRTDILIADINDLPDSVDQDVQNALAEGANNLKGQLLDPDKCQGASTTTTTESTQSTTSTRETTTTTPTRPTTTTTTPTQTQPTTTTPTQTTPTSPTGGTGPGGL